MSLSARSTWGIRSAGAAAKLCAPAKGAAVVKSYFGRKAGEARS